MMQEGVWQNASDKLKQTNVVGLKGNDSENQGLREPMKCGCKVDAPDS